MDRKKAQKIIRTYLADLTKSISVEKAIIFGSVVAGKLKKDSDIDLLILSPSFIGMSPEDRFDILYCARKRRITQDIPMDIFGLTKEEYEEASKLSLVGEIREKGKEISSQV